MPLSDELRSLLLKYIAGETDEEESRKVQEMLADNPLIFAEFEQLWDLWYAVGTATNVFRFNVDQGWETVLAASGAQHEAPGSGRFRITMRWVAAAAAVILVFLVLGLLWKNEHRNRADRTIQLAGDESSAAAGSAGTAPTSKTRDLAISTAPGKHRKVRLPDGSLAWLNGNTFISYRTDQGKRMLYLEGEAFFAIQHDAKRPFVVETKSARIRVLGTRFDVTAYPDDSSTEAVLTKGSIEFTTKLKDKAISKQLVPGERVCISHISNQVRVSRVDTAFYTSWRDGKLLFRGQTFREISNIMEHKYNVRFEFTSEALAEKRLNGYLEKESLTEAMEALQLTLQFHYKIIGGTVLLYQ